MYAGKLRDGKKKLNHSIANAGQAGNHTAAVDACHTGANTVKSMKWKKTRGETVIVIETTAHSDANRT